MRERPEVEQERAALTRETDREMAYQRLRSRAISQRIDKMLAEVRHVEMAAARVAAESEGQVK